MKNEQKFKEYMTLMGEIFNKEISDVYKSVYWGTLEPFSDEECEKVFNKVIATLKWFPKPAELLELLQGRQEDKAVLAWLKVEKAVREHGPYPSVMFDDPVIHAVIASLGGWDRFQDLNLKEWPWVRKDFERRYAIMQNKPLSDVPKYLPGQIERENKAQGMDEKTHIYYITDEKKLFIEEGIRKNIT